MLLIHLLVGCEPAAIVLPEVVEIRVEPAEVTLITGANGGEPVTFTAIGTDSDGKELTLEQVEWSGRSPTASSARSQVAPAR